MSLCRAPRTIHHFVVGLLLCWLLLITSSFAQNSPRCNTAGQFICVSRNAFQECVDGQPNMTEPIAISFCSDSGAFVPSGVDARTAVCYGGVSTTQPKLPCGAPPPACTRVGIFRVPGRCQDFYSCVAVGPAVPGASNFTMVFGVCQNGFEFNSGQSRCTSRQTAGCSISTTTTPAPPPTTTSRCILFVREPDPNSCRSYFRCNLFGVREHTRCPLNRKFDTFLRICSANANCGSRPL